MENIELNVKPENGELVVRQGKAAPIREKNCLNETGTIFAPAEFMENRSEFDLLNNQDCVLLSDKDNNRLQFISDQSKELNDKITGVLKPSREIGIFGINTGRKYGDKELADLFRKTRMYFSNTVDCTKAITSLSKFKAKVSADLENNDDQRGNTKFLIEKRVQTDLPETINLKIPIFQGFQPVEIEVLLIISVSGSGIEISLESYELYELEEKEKTRIFEAEENKFHSFGCAVIHLS